LGPRKSTLAGQRTVHGSENGFTKSGGRRCGWEIWGTEGSGREGKDQRQMRVTTDVCAWGERTRVLQRTAGKKRVWVKGERKIDQNNIIRQACGEETAEAGRRYRLKKRGKTIALRVGMGENKKVLTTCHLRDSSWGRGGAGVGRAHKWGP